MGEEDFDLELLGLADQVPLEEEEHLIRENVRRLLPFAGLVSEILEEARERIFKCPTLTRDDLLLMGMAVFHYISTTTLGGHQGGWYSGHPVMVPERVLSEAELHAAHVAIEIMADCLRGEREMDLRGCLGLTRKQYHLGLARLLNGLYHGHDPRVAF